MPKTGSMMPLTFPTRALLAPAESGYGGKADNVQVGDFAPVPLGGQA